MDLKHLSFFRHFSSSLCEALIQEGQVQHFSKGQAVFTSGDEPPDFFMLIAGRLRIYKISKGGQKRILRTVQPGDTFALVSLFDDRPMFITAEVLGDSADVFVIPRDAFMVLLEHHYELALFVIHGLVRRIRRYGEAMTSMTVYTTEQRLVAYLLELLDKENKESKEHKEDKGHKESKEVVLLPDTVTTLAEQLGTVREVLSREFSRLQKKGWIVKKGREVKLLDVDSLRKILFSR